MDTSGYFYTIAEVAITLVGFSGIIVALLGSGSPWRENDRYGLIAVVVTCAGALVFSLLPVGLLFLSMADDVVWSLDALLIGLLLVVGGVAFARARHRTQPRLVVLFWCLVTLSATLGVGLLLSALTLSAGPGVVALALLWLLILAFIQLATFLVAVSAGRL